jgi:hypothetical protein
VYSITRCLTNQKFLQKFYTLTNKKLTFKKNRKMKKIIIIVFGILLPFISESHNFVVIRTWCGGILYRRFIAEASLSGSFLSMPSMLCGSNPFPTLIKQQVKCDCSKGCSRPKNASVSASGTLHDQIQIFSQNCSFFSGDPNPYSGTAQTNNTVNGVFSSASVTANTFAGGEGTYNINPSIYSKLNNQGFFKNTLNAKLEIVNENSLKLENLTGFISIKRNTDFYAKLNIVVIKEKTTISEEEAIANENKVKNGIYDDCVFNKSIEINKNGIISDDLFTNNANTYSEIINDDIISVNFNNLNLTAPINATLSNDEQYTIMFYLDGGFDFRSAIVNSNTARVKQVIESDNAFCVLPNPVNFGKEINIKMPNDFKFVGTQKFEIFDLTGKKINQLININFNQNSNKYENVNIEFLPIGTYILKTVYNNKSISTIFNCN